MSQEDFPALPGFYKLLFLYLEPMSTIIPSVMAWVFPGGAWFWHQQIPSSEPTPSFLDPRTKMVMWQLGNCYLLLGLISSLVFRAVRDNLRHDLGSQERIMRASLLALAIADVSHIAVTWIALPVNLRWDISAWNPMTHGNITTVVVLLTFRLAYFAGVGRKVYSGQYVQDGKIKRT